MKRLLAVTIILIFTVGCQTQRAVPVEQEIVTYRYNLPPFKSIVLNGNAIIKLVNGSYTASITGPENYLYDDQVSVVNQILNIDTLKSANNIIIKISAPRLKNITVAGNSTMNAKDFKTTGLTVIAKDNGTINLEGKYIIDRIYQYGNGRINIIWVESDNLFIDSRSNGPIYLAGIVKNMVAKLTHNALLDARYLRVQKASVFTTDAAQANVVALDILGAFATNNSNIYYYNRPHIMTTVTNESGNVLHLD